jgi:hypothetical protein
VVKLTVENEQLKNSLAAARQALAASQADNTTLNSKLQELEAKGLGISGTEGLRQRKNGGNSADDGSATVFEEQEEEELQGLPLQWWQIAVLAMVFFVFGRIWS